MDSIKSFRVQTSASTFRGKLNTEEMYELIIFKEKERVTYSLFTSRLELYFDSYLKIALSGMKFAKNRFTEY